MLMDALPVFVTEMFCDILLPTVVVPKLMLVGVTRTEKLGESVCFLLLFALANPLHPEIMARQNSADIATASLFCHLYLNC
jgi:hypothetical protein